MNGILIMLWLAIAVFILASVWMVYVKANEPGWACIIPFYNFWVLLRMVGRPGWWLILAFIPIVDIVVFIIVVIDLAHSFEKGTGFGWGLVFLPFIFYPILGFGQATYAGPAGPEPWATTPQASMGYQAQSAPTMPPPPPASPPEMPPASG